MTVSPRHGSSTDQSTPRASVLCRRSIGCSSETRDIVALANAPLAFPTSYACWNLGRLCSSTCCARPKAHRRGDMAPVGALLDDFSPEECQWCHVNAGYGST